ncbi:HlyC/CorC family transporter [Mariniphaga sediminis]|jgi:CBS domain containing-hemolysin-like protein|uniref:HlyC/CorC family transporter n=1 Tax=Mariniphaga sediminis TaxID=1628158 RepID=A0A399DAH9_9BACT|nr:hemolysin family protein [Mariniphaga sediminis]RIH67172.1 HlyC/CorC family transporter [Mariniphaga sediminis]
MATLLFFFVLSIVISFFCSMWEAVILSVTPSYISRMQKEKPHTGHMLNIMKDDIDRPLSAILTLNTIAHTVGALGVGVQAGKLFGNHQVDFFFIQITFESLIAGGMTLAILVLSEIIPKTLGANFWKQLTPFTVRSLKVLMFVLAPFVWMSKGITRMVKTEKGRSVFSRADFAAMADAGLKSGALDREEKSIIQNLLRLENLKVRDIMTPRSVIVMIDEELTMGKIYEELNPMVFSRIPVYQEHPDNITGVILKDNILEKLAQDKHSVKASEIKRDILFVEDNFTVAKLMDTLILNREHLAVVADDFGSVVGLVTMEDLFETLLGLEIVDESDKVEDLQKLALEKWKKRTDKQRLKE